MTSRSLLLAGTVLPALLLAQPARPGPGEGAAPLRLAQALERGGGGERGAGGAERGPSERGGGAERAPAERGGGGGEERRPAREPQERPAPRGERPEPRGERAEPPAAPRPERPEPRGERPAEPRSQPRERDADRPIPAEPRRERSPERQEQPAPTPRPSAPSQPPREPGRERPDAAPREERPQPRGEPRGEPKGEPRGEPPAGPRQPASPSQPQPRPPEPPREPARPDERPAPRGERPAGEPGTVRPPAGAAEPRSPREPAGQPSGQAPAAPHAPGTPPSPAAPQAPVTPQAPAAPQVPSGREPAPRPPAPPAGAVTPPSGQVAPPAGRVPPPASPRPDGAVLPAPGRAGPDGLPGGFEPERERGVRRLDDVRLQRREVIEDGRTIIREPGRIIVRENDRVFIRRDEAERFRELGGPVRTERRGREILTFVERPGGVQIVTVVDEEGRLLRRARRLPDGREVVIIDNTLAGPPRPAAREVIDLPPPEIRIPRERYIVEAERARPEAIYEALQAPPVAPIERRYTLDEVRQSPNLRARMPSVDLDTITFESGSWEVAPDQVPRLETIARAINQAVQRNPAEVFLVEGHTDAVGSDIDNLSLSDRRAQAVAAVLTSAFQVPPENLTAQGYGEQVLKVNTQEAARENRRVTVRRITPLIAGQAQPR